MPRLPLAIVVGVLLTAGTAFAGKPKVALVPFEGDRDGQVGAAVSDVLDGDVAVVGFKEVNRTVERLGLDADLTDKDLKKLANELDADAIVQGKLDGKSGARVLHVRLFLHGKRAKGFKIEFATPKSDKFKTALHDTLVKKIGPGDGDDDEPKAKKKKVADDDDGDKPKAKDKAKDKKKKVADDDADDKPKAKDKKKKVADDDADDKPKAKDKDKKKKVADDDADDKPKAKDKDKKKKVADDDDKPKAKDKDKKKKTADDDADDKAKVADKSDKKDKDADKDDDKPKAKDKDADKDDDAPASKKKRTARADDDDDGGNVRAKVDVGVKSGGMRDAGRDGARVDVGPSFSNRSLSFVSRPSPQAPTNYTNSVVPGARVDGELYPLALSSPKSIAAGLGIAGYYDQTFGLSLQSTTAPGMKFAVTQRHFAVGVRMRFLFGDKMTSPGLTIGADYGARIVSVNRQGMNLDLPDVDYTYVAPGIGFRFPFTPSIAFMLGGRALLFSGAGNITSATEYGRARLTGLDGSVGFEVVMAKFLVVRLAGEFTQIGYAFTGAGEKTLDANGNALVGGATDRYLGGAITIGGIYDVTRIVVAHPDRKAQRALVRMVGASGLAVEIAEPNALAEVVDVDAIAVVDAELAAARPELRARPARAWIAVPGDGQVPADPVTVDALLAAGWTHVVAHAMPILAEELLATVQKLARREVFGLDKYVVWAATVKSYTVANTGDRDAVVAALAKDVVRLGLPDRVASLVSVAADELVANALYAAPVDDRGVHFRADEPRDRLRSLTGREVVAVRFATDARYLAIEVRDRWGSIDPDAIAARLSKTAQAARGDAGMGLPLVYACCNQLVIACAPGAATETMALIDVRYKPTDLGRSASFHVFTGELP